MTGEARRLLLNGEPLVESPLNFVSLLAQGAQIIVGPGAFDECRERSSEDGLTIAVKDALDLELPAIAMRWASLAFTRAMPGPKRRQANADELQSWQDVAVETGLTAGSVPQATLIWNESVPAMTVLVVWPEGSGADSSEVENLACMLEVACDAKLTAPPRKGRGGVFGWLVLLAMFGAAAYFVWGMG